MKCPPFFQPPFSDILIWGEISKKDPLDIKASQSESKTCHSTIKVPGVNVSKYIISISTRNSAEIFFWEMSTGRFSGNSPWVLLFCWIPSGQTFLQAEKMFCVPKSEISLIRKCSTLRLLEERARVPKSEMSLGNVAFRDFWRRGPESKIRDFPRKCGTLRLLEETPRNRDFSWEMWHFERLWGGLYAPMVCQLDNYVVEHFLAVRSQQQKFPQINFWHMSSRVNWKPGWTLRHGVCYFLSAFSVVCFPFSLPALFPFRLAQVLRRCSANGLAEATVEWNMSSHIQLKLVLELVLT